VFVNLAHPLAVPPRVNFILELTKVVNPQRVIRQRRGIDVEVFFEDWTAVSGAEDSRVWIPLFRPVR